MIEKQLGFVIKILEKVECAYWIDSGTLLSIVREGKLFERDNDIDIGMWDSEVDKIQALIDEFIKKGYRIEKYFYKDKLFSIKCIPIKKERKRRIKKFTGRGNCYKEAREIDICFYSRGGDFALNPQKHFLKNDFSFVSLKYYWFGIKKIFLYLYKSLNKITVINVDKNPWKSVMNTGTWKVPEKFFKATSKENEFGLNFPEKLYEYLSYRYGNWKKPKEDWYYPRDDRCFYDIPPEEMLEREV